jgi:uncharacterized membrane protein
MSTNRLAALMVTLGFGAVMAGACGNNPSPPKIDCTTVTVVPTYSEVAWPFCTSCHNSTLSGAARQDAPGDVNYDTYAAAKAHATQAAAQVNAGQMPPGGAPQMTEAQKTALYQWALCGTPM